MSIFCCCFDNKSISNIKSKQHHQYGVTSIAGFKPNVSNWINQDAYFIDTNLDSNDHQVAELPNNHERQTKDVYLKRRHTFCIFDGHGHNGHHVSSYCREKMLNILTFSGNLYSKVFEYLHESLENSDIDVDSSGTTCTIVIINEGKLEAYNVGDSKAMIARKTTAGLGFGFETAALTCDHTCDKEYEIQRIRKKGGKVCSRVVIDNEKTIEQGPLRVWYRCTNINSNFMGLAMTRSLGDSGAHKVGVTYEPYEHHQDLCEEDEFIILGSDGIWDVISLKEAASVINEYIISLPPVKSRTEWDPQEAADILVSRARRKWHNAHHVDDITCCIIKLTFDDGSPCFLE